MPTRRAVLIGLFGGGAFVAAAGGLSWFTLGYDLRPGELPLAMSAKEFVVARAIVEALLPGGDGLPAGVDVGVPQRLDEELWSAPPEVTADLKAALLVVEHAPPLLGFAGRFSSLSVEARQDCLRAMLASDRDVLVQVVVAFKQMAHLFFYAVPATWGAIGYDGPWVTEEKPPPTSIAYRALLAARRGP